MQSPVLFAHFDKNVYCNNELVWLPLTGSMHWMTGFIEDAELSFYTGDITGRFKIVV